MDDLRTAPAHPAALAPLRAATAAAEPIVRYPFIEVALWAVVPVSLAGAALAGLGAALTNVSMLTAIECGLTAFLVLAGSAFPAMLLAWALSPAEVSRLSMLVMGASLVRKITLVALAVAAQFLLHPPAIPFWIALVVSFVAFSIAEIRVLRPHLERGENSRPAASPITSPPSRQEESPA
jgi:hypothetical protein